MQDILSACGWAAAIAGGVAAVIKLAGYMKKISIWIENQSKQDEAIKAIKDEQCLITYGLLSALKGLQEQGCDGPVTNAIDKIEKHINMEAHK